ncbi:prolyl oligopeptidase family serine peptidase [Aliiglaciecola sp. CAU 1673]|uniref:S9 family peptidase n=1 Tax=Aliiglaciecola sp. CAU 1673 TaxID=3032595 RepID=UPI0023DB19A4|nr:prolyl oligopeptidase family serine peptidase [Aliiglaciecola sp. CAU 1673]MDF2179999.1 prolyl oligopeptidase family serine peptidase [Aliiglaciecola sp. CAU 1673]
MQKFTKTLLITLISAGLSACAATSQPPVTSSAPQVEAEPVAIVQSSPALGQNGEIVLEQIMADPDWIGREPQNAYWALDSQHIRYQRKMAGSPVLELYQTALGTPGNGNAIDLSDLHKADNATRVFNQDATKAAWVFEGNLFVKDLATGMVTQLTQQDAQVQAPQFLLDGRLAYRLGNAFLAIDLSTGISRQVVSWKFADKPKAVQEPKDYLAKEQLQLIETVVKERAERQAHFERRQAIKAANSSLVPEPFYFDSKFVTAEASLSPDGKRLVLAIEEDKPSRSEKDIMPNYIGEDGRIKSEAVRRMVAEAEPNKQALWLLDLEKGTQSELSFASLPGYNEDVLAAVKKENAAAEGETYQSNRLPRDIGLITDWYWTQSAIRWHNNGRQVAVMLKAWDNKDRWIATVDFRKNSLVSQHRLHDDAWINYKFNSFGWLNNSETLYFLSEQSGYAHLYKKTLNTKEQALTFGRYEVDDLTLTRDDQYIYFRANIKHPGIYEVYRVSLTNGDIQAMTDMGGNNLYVLSPDEQKLLVNHSTVTMPPELYVQQADVGAKPVKYTDTVSDAFKAMPWSAPQIVPVPSSHSQQPIYAKLYLPEGYQEGEKRKAVIFNHGAGYLQNSHLGWSVYFREFMFHSMLVQQGYVVMDMDYRASQGYGRDWRTAIYRQMGTPEIQDLRDGVSYMVTNANVDEQGVCTYGGSYGGFMTFMALFTAPDLFQCGAALRPVTDWAYYNIPYTSNILNTPDVDPIAYQRSSPIYFAEGLQKPLLINAPMVDNNVFFVDVVRLVQRLIELEKQDFETAIYPVESHGFRQPSSWLDEYRRIYKLFQENLH